MSFLTCAPKSSLDAFRQTLQSTVMEQQPGVIEINGTRYDCAVMSRMGNKLTLDGGFVQERRAVFSVLKEHMDLAIVRDTSKPEKPLRLITIKDVESGLLYVLTNETSDSHSPSRRLECEQKEG